MPCVGFEPTIPASEQAKTVHVLDRSATVTGRFQTTKLNFLINFQSTRLKELTEQSPS
jgi:hypothetical protein